MLTVLENRLPEEPKATTFTHTQTDDMATYLGDHTYVEDSTTDQKVTYMLIDNQVIPKHSDLSEILECIPNPEVSMEPALAATMDEYNQLDI